MNDRSIRKQSRQREPSSFNTTSHRLNVLRLSLLLSAVFAHFLPVAQSAHLVGCYVHSVPSPTLHFLQSDLTVEFCETQCGQRGYHSFGLHAASECWCGTYDQQNELEAEAGGCNAACGGNREQVCGGQRADSVHKVDPASLLAHPPAPAASVDTTDAQQPLLALVMIVKDEAHTLPSTLRSLAPYLDYYYILDTGSTDGTQAVIRQVLGERGEMWEEPFIDYGRSRNRVLDIAQHSTNPPVFVLMLSADETVYNAYQLRQFCELHRHSTGAAHEAYPLVMETNSRFDSLRLSRTAAGWRYVGRVHEYLAAPDQQPHPTIRVPDTYIRFQATDAGRRSSRELGILAILEEETRDEPTNTRASFYLASAYSAAGNHTAALDEYRRRVELGGWREEVYHSMYAIPAQLAALGRPWAEQEQAYLHAYDHSPERAEPLYAIAAHYYYEDKMPPLAFLYASHAATLPYPQHAVLWVEADVYGWQCNAIVGMTAHRLGPQRYAEGYLALRAAVERGADDKAMHRQLSRYKRLLGEDEVRRLDSGGLGRAQALLTRSAQTSSEQGQSRASLHQQQQLAHVRPSVAHVERAQEAAASPATESGTWLVCWLIFAAVAVAAAFAAHSHPPLSSQLSLILRHSGRKLFRRLDGQMSDKVV